VPLLLALVLTIAGTLVAPAAASTFHTRATGHIAAGAGVELRLQSFDLHDGNSTCGTGTPEHKPDLVPAGQSRGFCYEAKCFIGSGCYDTEFTFKYRIWIDIPYGFIGHTFRDSGYTLVGHALIIATGEDNKLSCGIEQTDPSLATEHFDCQLDTERNAKRSLDPAPTWKVTFSPTPDNVPRVIFIGDSVTAGVRLLRNRGRRELSGHQLRPEQPDGGQLDGRELAEGVRSGRGAQPGQ
jgi:hypothetical protein